MQNLTNTSKTIFDQFSQTEREYRNKEAELQREISYLEGRLQEAEEETADLQSNIEDLQEEVADQNIQVSDLEDQLVVIGDESLEVERVHERRRDELQEADGIIEETYEQVCGMIRMIKEKHADIDDAVYADLMRMLRSSQSVLLRR
jgi:chromosome segregation ATPase